MRVVLNKSDYLNAPQLARLLGISAITVRTRARTDPSFVRHIIAPNGHLMFDKKLVNEFIAQQAASLGWPVEETPDE